jgi:hypothetical protein
MTPFCHPSIACRALLLAALVARPGHLSAQTSATLNTEAGTIAGAVLDGASGQPLAGAQVALEPAPGGAVMGRGAFWTAGRTATTDAAGRYGFNDVAAGAYSLHVRFIGYRPTTIDVDLRSRSTSSSTMLFHASPSTVLSYAVVLRRYMSTSSHIPSTSPHPRTISASSNGFHSACG